MKNKTKIILTILLAAAAIATTSPGQAPVNVKHAKIQERIQFTRSLTTAERDALGGLVSGRPTIISNETTGQLEVTVDGGTTWLAVPTLSGGGSSLALDLGDNGTDDSTAIVRINTTGDTSSIITESPTDEILIDVSQEWPLATLANSATIAEQLDDDALDGISEIADSLLTGSDTQLVTGTAGTSGFLGTWNGDGDMIGTGLAEGQIFIGDVAGIPQKFGVSGDIAMTAGGVVTIQPGAVDLATDTTGDLALDSFVQATAASRLLGRGSAAGAGDFQEITIGTGLSLTGTVLSASGDSKWTDTGTTIHPTDNTDEIVLGGTSPYVGAKFSIDGDANQVQFAIEGVSGQSEYFMRFDANGGTPVAIIDANGRFAANNGYDATGAGPMPMGSADVTNMQFFTDGTGTAEIVLPSGAIDTTEILDDTVGLADLAHGTAGELLSFNGSGAPAYVATGTLSHVLTSNGPGAAPTFQAPGTVFSDNVFRIQDDGDSTKRVAFELSSITTGNTRTITIPDSNGTITFLEGVITLPYSGTHNYRGASILAGGAGSQFMIFDASDTNGFQFVGTEITGNRAVTLPALTAADTFVFEDHAQGLENKTIDADNNTISNIGSAEITDGSILDADLGAISFLSDDQTDYTIQTNADFDLAGDYFIFYDVDGGDWDRMLMNELIPFRDDFALIKDSGLGTARMRIDVISNVTAGNTRVLSMADQNIDMTPGADYLSATVTDYTVDAAPDGAADYVIFRDTTANTWDRVLIDDIASGGSSEWTDTGTIVHLNETGDDLVLGGTALVQGGKLSIDGDADQVQLAIRGHTTQTNALLRIQDSADVALMRVVADGSVQSAAGYDAIGAAPIGIGSADVTAINVTTDGTGTAEVALPAGSIDSTEILDGTITDSDLATGAGGPPTGSVIDYAGSTAPTGWLLCDGSTVSRTTYADLFAVIGTTYGAGDGSTTFGLPDARGRVTAGLDDMNNTVGTGGGDAGRLTTAGSGVDGDTLGTGDGHEEMQAHTHSLSDRYDTGSRNMADTGSGVSVRQVGVTNAAETTGSTGGGDSENVQPTLVLNKIIKE